MKLTNRVKSLRSSNGWTQEQFAQMIGVTRQTIISLEKGSYTPSLLLAMQIARVFERPVESIFYLEEESE
ncbi:MULTISPECIES: helix-turn-helix transcriptional regulator [Exiguobacterium]|uniref:Helix-turn-helix transcriptional regulator n=1 Tax=Exiguobacterium antarcticum TaxID=132920 RepID=A0ABT6R5A0_9BACL|nr:MULTISPECIES: helix-turn-helix transcriptional regulator [Exiguobacterium]HSN66924.1 helix-turn-helix transcriptional regulator [Fusibacter sp.]AFS70466.1 DNA-binding protein [Exiguobacterium antarcticum B7]MCT4780395.1 helix-turn-helix transcriptional regulator [Exiguobacterium soli]MDI3236135.1 helix-turn-helix transcriptional regulator [Exiguobacterium antarcticum]MDX1259043.1 helix-turn-helix transcriptional regulator [Exiguobacterium sp. K1]